MQQEHIVERVRTVTAPYLARQWATLADHPLVGEARSVGLMGAIELVQDKGRRQRFAEPGTVGTICRDICFENGLVMRAVYDSMIIAPPLVISYAEIDELVSIARSCLDQTLLELKRRQLL
jgi:putrescine aminotransferase